MTLVDTSVWIDHFRRGRNDLIDRLVNEHVLGHPFVIGELACGNLRQRTEILTLMGGLPRFVLAEHDDVRELIESYRLMGLGLGWVDVHLLASCRLAGASLWTLDSRLHRVASRLEVAE